MPFEYLSQMIISQFRSPSHKDGSIKNSVKKECYRSANCLVQTNLSMLRSPDLVFVSVMFDTFNSFFKLTLSDWVLCVLIIFFVPRGDAYNLVINLVSCEFLGAKIVNVVSDRRRIHSQ